MAVYTITKTFRGSASKPAILAVKANGGTITVELPVGTDWVVAGDVISADGVFRIETGFGNFRVTPTGGAAYEVR